jgi:hypothetical protein
MRNLLFILFLILFCQPLLAQRGWGLRFASDFNHFNRSKDYFLVDGWYSTGVFGGFYRAYNHGGGYEIGLSAVYKGNTPKSVNLPVVMRDYTVKGNPQKQSVGVTAIESNFLFGPRVGRIFNPKTGYKMGYFFKNAGFQEDSTLYLEKITMNRFYLSLPFGGTVDLPTKWGTVGFGAFYSVGLLNVMKKPKDYAQSGFYDGSKLRNLNFEITVTLNTENQKFKGFEKENKDIMDTLRNAKDVEEIEGEKKE